MIDELKKGIEIIVPHEEQRQFYKSVLDTANRNPSEVFENGKYKFGYSDSDRNGLTPDHKEIPKYLFFDLLTETYLPLKRRIKNMDLLWSNLSVLLINFDCNHLRRQLDFNMYDYKDIDFTVDNVSLVFVNSNHLVYQLNVHGDKAIGLLHRDKFDELEGLLTMTGVEIKELR